MRLPWRGPQRRASGEATRSLRVLLIDDDEDEYTLLRDAFRDFEDTDYELEWAASYGAGIEAVKRAQHDVILVDYRLGGMNGVDLVREARAAGIRAPLIMLTGQREREVDLAAMEAGAVDFLVKGRTEPALLERTIRYAIAQTEATIALERSLAQVEGLERVGRLLAEHGPTPEALDAVLDVLVGQLDQAAAAVYLMERGRLELAAQRGYVAAVPKLDPASGRLSKLLTGGGASFVPSIATDPDSDARRGMELAVPLMNRSACTGLLLVASPDGEPLSGSDFHVVLTLADRVAVAMALADEHDELSARVSRTDRLVAFARTVGATLDAERLHEEIVEAAATVVPADLVILATPDPAGAEIVRAARGASSPVGASLEAHPARGEGTDLLAVIDRQDIRAEHGALQELSGGALARADLLLERDEQTVGRLVFARRDPRRPFDPGEQEAIRIMGGLIVLALANVASHAEVTERSVRDPLTGLPNRRFFQLSVTQLTAQRARQEPDLRGPMAAIMYDLDHFGAINKQHGHAVGDTVLRAFAAVLGARTRQGDIVARYGGEEFAVVMVDATRDDAMRVAEEILAAFAATAVTLDDGTELRATVSAGCAALGADENDVDGLLRTADVALSVAKRAGRNVAMAA